jgi:hypothetical protein
MESTETATLIQKTLELPTFVEWAGLAYIGLSVIVFTSMIIIAFFKTWFPWKRGK